MRKLVATFDVSKLTTEQADMLGLEVRVQGEASDDHPDAPIVSIEIEDDGDPDAIRDTCAWCEAAWGSCTCQFPDPKECDVREVPGFDYQGMWIVQPNVSVCGRFYVDPVRYYGKAYTDWRDANGMKGIAP